MSALPHDTQGAAERFMRALYRRIRELIGEEVTRRYGHVISETGGVSGAALPYATPALTLGGTAAAGSAARVIRADATVRAFDDGATPANLAATAATGDDAYAARRDHVHTDPVPAHVAATDPHAQYQKESEKGAANGYASLDATGKVPDGQLPDGLARDAELAAAIAAHEAAADPHPGYQRESEKAQPGGYAGLDGSGHVPPAQLGSGTADATTSLRGDGTWQVASGGASIRYEPLTNGNPSAPELVFDAEGDVIMVPVP